MRVTFLIPREDMSGGARVIHIHADALQRMGHEVTVIVPALARPSIRQRFRSLLRRHIEGASYEPASHYRGGLYRLIRLDRNRPIVAADVAPTDVTVATWWQTAEWLLAMPDTVGAKVHFVQGYEAFDSRFKPQVDAVLAADTYKITISTWLNTKLQNEFRNAHISVVPNGVDTRQFYATDRDRQSAFTIGALYSGKASKNTALAFTLFEAVRAQYLNARLVMFGAESEVPGLPLPDGATLTVLPAQHRIRDLYAQCDVWLCTSLSEGFHLPPLEAMACRCPVISTPVGGPQDIIKEGENGFLFFADDPNRAVALLLELADMDNTAWRRLSEKALATALGMRWEPLCTRFEQALFEAIEQAGNREKLTTAAGL